MALSTEDILSAFDTMTILELSEFSKAFQDRYGVTASAPMGMMAAMPMQVFNDGTTDLTALIMFVVDATKPFSVPATLP